MPRKLIRDCIMGCEVEYSIPLLRGSADEDKENRLRAYVKLFQSIRQLNISVRDMHPELGCFLSNASNVYLDIGLHLEFASPEVTSPLDVVVYQKANERILEQALHSCIAPYPFSIYKNNVDFRGNTYGMHENYLIDGRVMIKDIQLLTTFLVTRQIFAGAGRISFDTRACGYELSQRARFICREISDETTRNRAIINTKNEPLSGRQYRRVHLILGDSLRSDLGIYLQIGTTALLFRLIEQGVPVGDGLALQEPVEAIKELSCNPCQQLTLMDGRTMSAVELQMEYLDQALMHAYQLPDWTKDVLVRWEEVLCNLAESTDYLQSRLDWQIKHLMLDRFLSRRDMTWNDVGKWGRLLAENQMPLNQLRSIPKSQSGFSFPDTNLSDAQTADMFQAIVTMLEMDIRYHDINRETSLFDILDNNGLLNHRLLSEESIVDAMTSPPKGTRAELRGKVIKEISQKHRNAVAQWTQISIPGVKVLNMQDPYSTIGVWEDACEERVQSERSEQPDFIRRMMD